MDKYKDKTSMYANDFNSGKTPFEKIHYLIIADDEVHFRKKYYADAWGISNDPTLIILDRRPNGGRYPLIALPVLSDLVIGIAFNVDSAKDRIDTLDKFIAMGNIFKSYTIFTDFGLGDGDGNDIAGYARNMFGKAGIPLRIIGNTGGDPDNFDSSLVDAAFSKIMDPDKFRDIITRSIYGVSR